MTWTPRTDTTPRPTPIDGMAPPRWAPHRDRIQMLEDTWRSQLATALVEMVGIDRASGWGRPSTARNLFAEVCEQLAVLYVEPFEVQSEDPEAAAALHAWATAAEVQQVLGETQLYAVGLGTCYVRIDTHDEVLRYERVSPDLVEDHPAPGRRQPDWIREYRLRDAGWEADEYDVMGPSPTFRRWRLAGGRWEVVETLSGAGYPSALRMADGTPIHPYVLYRSAPPRDGLHAPLTRDSLRAGSLDVAVLYSMVMHVFKDASWPQRYALGARPYGGGTASDTSPTAPPEVVPRHEVVTDPAVILLLEKIADFEGQPSIGQWQPGGDPEKLYEVLDRISAQLAVGAGLSPTDLQRTAPNRSGAAIALSNEGKRAAQRAFMPLFRPSDELLLAKTAVLLNRMDPALNMPEAGYKVAYRQLSLSVDELSERRKHALEMLDAGLMTRAEAYVYLHPGITEDEAERRLAVAPPVPTPGASAPPDAGPDSSAAAGPSDALAAAGDVQGAALNGAQVTALADLAAQVATGQLPLASAKAIAAAAFPLVAAPQLEDIFGPLAGFSPDAPPP